MCRDPLSEQFREQFRPQTQQERERLENVLATLDGLGDMFRQLESSQKKKIMREREKEFGIEGGGIGDLIKLALPAVFLFLALFVVFLALTT